MTHSLVSTHRIRSGFTLIEILIVVVILGILAAVIIPQFTNAADDASISSARTQLQTMRSQVELYRAQNGAYPTANGAAAGSDVDSNGSQDHWDDLIDGSYMRSSPVWPSLFTESYTASSGDLALVLASPYYDVNGDGTADSADATVVGRLVGLPNRPTVLAGQTTRHRSPGVRLPDMDAVAGEGRPQQTSTSKLF